MASSWRAMERCKAGMFPDRAWGTRRAKSSIAGEQVESLSQIGAAQAVATRRAGELDAKVRVWPNMSRILMLRLGLGGDLVGEDRPHSRSDPTAEACLLTCGNPMHGSGNGSDATGRPNLCSCRCNGSCGVAAAAISSQPVVRKTNAWFRKRFRIRPTTLSACERCISWARLSGTSFHRTFHGPCPSPDAGDPA
jgi:hypothetical protein